MSLLSYGIGTGVTLDGTNYQVGGRSFNPYIPINWTGSIDLTGVISNGSTISLSGYQYGHEVLVAAGEWDVESGHFIQYRKGSKLLFTFVGAYEGMYGYQGIDYDEIMSNGTDYYVDFGSYENSSDEGYYANVSNGNNYIDQYQSPNFYNNVNVGDEFSIDFYTLIDDVILYNSSGTYNLTAKEQTSSDWDKYTFNGNVPNRPSGGYMLAFMYTGKNVEGTINYGISNMPTVYEGPSGRLWVEGGNLCFTDAVKGDIGYKHIIKNDGVSYSTGKTPGMIWIGEDEHGKICYIDENGIERKTHRGDIRGSQGNNEYDMSGKTPGYMWVSSTEGNYGYLTFIANNGEGYRIMNGDV